MLDKMGISTLLFWNTIDEVYRGYRYDTVVCPETKILKSIRANFLPIRRHFHLIVQAGLIEQLLQST